MLTPNHFFQPVLQIFFAAIFIMPAFAQDAILILDDFESYPENSFHGMTDVFPDSLGSDIERLPLQNFEAFRHKGKSLRLDYKLSADSSGFCGSVSELPSIDLSGFGYLSFWIKSKNGGDMVRIELERENGEKSKLSVWDYLPCGPSRQWQKVVIPLDDFWNLSERTDIVKLVISFESRSSYLSESPFDGEIYLDDFLCGKYFPGYVKFDSFNDKLPGNATGANNGNFSDTLDFYSSELACDNFSQYPCDCHLKLHFNNGEEARFGGYFAILGGGENGWTKIGHDVSQYDSLHLKAFASNDATNPGNFKVELKQDSLNYYWTRILGINTDVQAFSKAISDFNVEGNPVEISEFTIVFEKNFQFVNVGEVAVDEIELRSAGHQLPDVAKPPAPQNVTLNGTAPTGVTMLAPNTTATVSANIDIADPKLESVRLEYYRACAWHCLGQVYCPFPSPQATFSFSTGDLPPNRQMDMRVVAENYNGQSCPGETFSIIVGGGDGISAEELFRNAFAVFQHLRAETGVYTDGAVFQGEPFHPASVATTGMGLVSLCIADAMGWIDNAENLVLESLTSMNGMREGFQPERNCAGWFRHFIWQDTGEQAWDSEFSSIDSGILVAGALFCKKYFSGNADIAALADKLYLSIDWASMIADPESGGIYRVSDCNGNGSGITLPFNEYMIVAWLAKNDFRNNGPASELWSRHYADPAGLPKSSYRGIDVLTDLPGNFLSGFVPQFAYYLCNYFTSHPGYFHYFENAMRADSLWWRDNTNTPCYVWGFGAGSSKPDWSAGSGYHADDIAGHPGTVCSPHIIGGFIPANPNGLQDLIELYLTPLGVRRLQDAEETPVLWRFSIEDPSWMPPDIQGIDFSSMLLGLAAHPDVLGAGFFELFNDFDFPDENTAANYPPEITGLPDVIDLADTCTIAIPVSELVPGSPPSMLDWVFQGNDSIQITADGATCNCRILISVDPGFSGSESVVFIANGPDGHSDMASVTINAPGGCLSVNVGEAVKAPVRLILMQNYPNPFKSATAIPFTFNDSGEAAFSVFDLNGNEVFRKNLGWLAPGDYAVEWNGTNSLGIPLPPGVYFYRIEAARSCAEKKMVLIR